MNILKTTSWFAANVAWNCFISVVIMVMVACLIDAHVPGEAASIGLVEVSEAPLWWSLAIANFAAWGISFSIGWGSILSNMPWGLFFFMSLINS